jgi:hypothetical protein
MSALTKRVAQLEAHAAKRVRPAGSWATYWQSLRKIYGDGGAYTPAELEQLDRTDPAGAMKRARDRMTGTRANDTQNAS